MATLPPEKIRILADSLYETARLQGDREELTQHDLIALGVIPHNDLTTLVTVVQDLVNQKLFDSLRTNSGLLAWRSRSREDAKKYISLPSEETRLVYAIIDDAGADGVWSRTIKNKLHMQDSTLKGALKLLEQKGYVADMKNVEHPNKKMYIKANLRPSDRATGGPWFNDGALDSAFVAELERVAFEYIKRNSAYLSSHSSGGAGSGATKVPKKGAVTHGTGAANGADPRGKKRPSQDISTDDAGSHAAPAPAPAQSLPSSREAKKNFLPLPAGYTEYPTVSSIAKFIHDTGIAKNTTLSETDVQQLVDVLVFDGLIEPIRVGRRRGYRVSRATKQDTMLLKERMQKERDGNAVGSQFVGVEPLSNGLTEAPCGRCPVFELCEEGGPVNPSNCVYFERWLESGL